MSKELDKAIIDQFDAEVKHAYQGMGYLRKTVKSRMNVNGGTYQFQKMGKGMASKRTPQSEVQPMGVTHDGPTATLEDWDASEYTDIFEDAKTKIQERKELAKVIAGALERREDQLILDELNNTSFSQTVADDIGGTDTNLNIEKLRATREIFDDNEILNEEDREDSPEITLLCSAKAKRGLLSEKELTSADYNTVKALVQGETDEFMGFKFVTIGSRDEGGLPVPNSNKRTLWAYADDAVGLAVNMDKETEVNYVPTRKSWLASGSHSAGAAVIDGEGVVEITIDES